MTTYASHLLRAMDGWGFTERVLTNSVYTYQALQGGNRYYAVIQQSLLLNTVRQTACQLYPSLLKNRLYYVTGLIVTFVAPAFMAYAARHPTLQSTPRIRWTFRLLHLNMGLIGLAAHFITALAILRLGHVSFALASFAAFSSLYFSLPSYLPQKLRQLYGYATLLNQFIYTARCGDRFYQLSYILRLLILIPLSHSSSQLTPYEDDSSIHRLNYDNFRNLEFFAHPPVDRKHIYTLPLPHYGKVDYQNLKKRAGDILDALDPKSKELLNAALLKDTRVIAEDTTHMSELEKIGHTKQMFDKMVTSIQHRSIKSNETLNYAILDQYLGIIEKTLPTVDPILRSQAIIRLATEGGDHCAPALYRTLEETAVSLLMNEPMDSDPEARKRFPLKQRILIFLQQERYRIMQGFYEVVCKTFPISEKIYGGEHGKEETHIFNSAIKLLGTDFGLPHQGAAEDGMLPEASLGVKLIAYFFEQSLWENFEGFEGYTPYRIVNSLKSEIGNSFLPAKDIHDWSRAWIDSLQMETVLKAQLRFHFKQRQTDPQEIEKSIEELFTQGIHEESQIDALKIEKFLKDLLKRCFAEQKRIDFQQIDTALKEQLKALFIEQAQNENLKFHSWVLEAMLVDMGILEITS